MVIAAFIVILIWIIGGIFVAGYGASRGFPVFPILIASWVFSPVLVLLVVAVVPERPLIK